MDRLGVTFTHSSYFILCLSVAVGTCVNFVATDCVYPLLWEVPTVASKSEDWAGGSQSLPVYKLASYKMFHKASGLAKKLPSYGMLQRALYLAGLLWTCYWILVQ
jgi:hypothetical protein